jgi:hypothetical protein
MNSIKFRMGIVATLSIIWDTGAFSQQGRLVTASDIFGRKICWDGGYWDKFAANGQHFWGLGATADPRGPDTWALPEQGVIHTGRKYRQTEILSDGRFHTYSIRGHGQQRDTWGAVCS